MVQKLLTHTLTYYRLKGDQVRLHCSVLIFLYDFWATEQKSCDGCQSRQFCWFLSKSQAQEADGQKTGERPGDRNRHIERRIQRETHRLSKRHALS